MTNPVEMSKNELEELRKKYDWHNRAEKCKCYMCALLSHIEFQEERIEGLNASLLGREARNCERISELEGEVEMLDRENKEFRSQLKDFIQITKDATALLQQKNEALREISQHGPCPCDCVETVQEIAEKALSLSKERSHDTD